jgi:hypothetical protein
LVTPTLKITKILLAINPWNDGEGGGLEFNALAKSIKIISILLSE